MIRHAKRRATKSGVPFSLTESDIFIPAICPALGILLVKNIGGKTGSDNSPSLDRIIPRKGYVPGNVIVVSYKANRIKSDATPDELQRIVRFYKRLLRTKCKPSTARKASQ